MLLRYCLPLLIFSCSTVRSGVESGIPHGWSSCSEKSHNYNECLKHAISTAIKSLKNGNKELGVPPLEPLCISKLVINQRTGGVHVLANFDNFKFTGLTNFQVKQVQNDWKCLKIKLFYDKLTMNGVISSMNGTIFDRPICGSSSPASYEWFDLTFILTLDLSEVEENGQTYFHVDKMSVLPLPGDVNYRIDNMYNGNNKRGKSMNRYLNGNWKPVTDGLVPAISEAFGNEFAKIANIIFSKIPACELRKV